MDINDQEESSLTRILTYTNSSKIFFVKKIILVEGPTDEYFYRVFLDKVIKDADKLEDVEIVGIQGKGDFAVWRRFLHKFKISNYYVGDLDNILDEKIGLVDTQKKNSLFQEAKKYDQSIEGNPNK